MGTEYQGYKDLSDHLELIRTQIPKGISLTVRGKKLSFQFATQNTKRSKYPINENYTVYGLNKALEKAIKVSDKLSNYDSENEFWDWYDKEIKGINKETVADLITFDKAIAKVEQWFYNRKDRRGLKRTKESDYRSYRRAYGYYLSFLPNNKIVNFESLNNCLTNYCDDREQSKYQDCLSAYLKLCEVNELSTIYNQLHKFKRIRTKKSKEISRQSLSLEEFFKLRELLLSEDSAQYYENRKYWLWVYSMQLIYGLRIAEIPAIKNLDCDYIPANDYQENSNDETVFKALSDPQNKDNIIYVGNYTIWGTKVKTGSRIAMPLIPVDYPNLIDLLEIKNIYAINNKNTSVFTRVANQRLLDWTSKYLGKKISQTHTFRKLGNANGISAGIADSIRCKSLGHSEAINAKHYQNWSGQTTIDLYKNAKRQPIDLKSAKKLIEQLPPTLTKDDCYQLLASIYQASLEDVLNQE